MSSPFLGEIRGFSFQFAPKGWVACAGQLLSIQQNAALFSLLGTTYGGNGVQNFALPDLRGRIGMGMGSADPLGQVQGTENVTLLTTQLPQHRHNIDANNNGTTNGVQPPGPTVILGSPYTGQGGSPTVAVYAAATPDTALIPLTPAGSSLPHENRMPSLVMNYCIATSGIFPSRN